MEATEAAELFRGVNERIRELDPDEPGAELYFVCECEDERCFRSVPIAAAAYDRLRADGTLLLATSCATRPTLAEALRPAVPAAAVA